MNTFEFQVYELSRRVAPGNIEEIHVKMSSNRDKNRVENVSLVLEDIEFAKRLHIGDIFVLRKKGK